MNSGRCGMRCWTCLVWGLLALLVLGCAGGIPSIPDSPEAILAKGDRYFQKKKFYSSHELYKAFLARHPGHSRSDYAQFMLAESYFNDEDYLLAGVEYRILMSNYGYSDYVDEAYFKGALCNYHQGPKPQLDQTKTYQALSQFQQFVQVFPESPLVPEAQEYIAQINEKLAKKEIENTRFYFRRKLYISAMIYADKIIDNYPDNQYWVEAKYIKAKIFVARGEEQDALGLLREVIEYPDDLRVKRDAELLLKRLTQG